MWKLSFIKKKREREEMNLREKFNLMRRIIIKQQEITETELLLELDDNGIGQATYNKIKKDFRINSEKVGIHYDKNEKTYRIGAKQVSLSFSIITKRGYEMSRYKQIRHDEQ